MHSATYRGRRTGFLFNSSARSGGKGSSNLTSSHGNAYEYNRIYHMTKMLAGAEGWRYIYTAGDERFWSCRVGGGGSLWALRDLDGRLLREYEAHTSWSTFKDYIYRGTQLLASSHSTEGTRHFHLDHLGTPRLVTGAGSGGDFYTLTPCRVLDTRNQSAPLSAGETRQVPMTGSCGIPAGATAVSVNITVVDATTQGEMTGYPASESRPTASAISYLPGLARANNGILKLGNGALAFFNNQLSGSAHLIIDVNGYFTEDAGAVVAYHVYYPFGEEATAFNQDAEQMKFTGHERDLASAAGTGDDLDYMHARHYSPLTGRFFTTDPVRSGLKGTPQSWNRFSYTLGNPLKQIDPDGLETQLLFGRQTQNNVFGHVAVAIDGTVYSYGTHHVNPSGDWGVPIDKYLAAQEGKRETEIFTLKVSAEQEDKLNEYLQGQLPSTDEYSALSYSCVTVCEVALQAAGILKNEPGPVTVDSAGNELQAGAAHSITPADLSDQVQNQCLVGHVERAGREQVSKSRALFNTIVGFFRRNL